MINIDTRLFELIKDESQMWLLMHIAKRINKNRFCFPKNSTLAKDCGWGDNKLQKVKKQLKDLGILKVEARKIDGRQRANNYIVNTDLIGVYISLDKFEGTSNEGTLNEAPLNKGTLNEGGLNEGTLKKGNISINKDQVLTNKQVLTNLSSISGDSSPATNPKKEVETKKEDKPLAEPLKAQRLNEQLVKQFKEVMEHFIAKTGRAFKIAKTDALIKRSDKFKKIAARLRDGHTVSDLKTVIDTKCKEWLESPKMSQFLQPSTLFCLKNFEKYLDQAQNTNLISHETRQQQPRTNRNGARTSQKFRDGVDGFLKAYSQAISVEDIDHDELAAS